MPEYVRSIRATGIHGRFDLEQEFRSGVNILYGKNGAGKTTFLHILSNALNADYRRFSYLNFDSIEIGFNDDTVLTLRRFDEDKVSKIEVSVNNRSIVRFSTAPERHEGIRSLKYSGILLEHSEEKEHLELAPILPAEYFPAFRTMIEAWSSNQDEESSKPIPSSAQRKTKATRLAREIFGHFVPEVNYPSPVEIEQRLSREIQQALFKVAESDERLLSQAFLEVFAALSSDAADVDDPPDQILDQINALNKSLEESSIIDPFVPTPNVYLRLRDIVSSFRFQGQSEGTAARILDVYRKSLSKRAEVQRESFEHINKYLDSVNLFLEGKRVEKKLRRATRHKDSLLAIEFDAGFSGSLRTLSSGERQIVTLIYAATHMNKQRVVLVDEPEISLHVDWQRVLIKNMSEQLEGRQIFACTHSPIIAADYPDAMIELKLIGTRQLHGGAGKNMPA
jgi:predicted ATP-binding protein involved in virulence